MEKKKLLVIGFGRMAKAIFSGMKPANCPYDITVVKPSLVMAADTVLPVQYAKTIDQLPNGYKPAIVLFAVKPEMLGGLLKASAEKFKGQKPLYISILAARPVAAFTVVLGDNAKVLRVMPNLPIQVGQGISLIYPSKDCSPQDIADGHALFSGQSHVITCRSEEEFDQLTVNTGCTPGFLFEFMSQFERAMKTTSTLSAEDIHTMTIKLIKGVVLYAEQHPGVSFELMAKQVATQGGLTEAGLKTMWEDPVIQKAFAKAITAANERGAELAAQAN